MQTPATLQRTLQALLITGISIFVLAPASAGEPFKVTADRVTSLDIIVQAAVNWMKRLGRGATDTLQRTNAFHEPKP